MEFISVDSLSKKGTLTGTEKIPVSSTEYVDISQIGAHANAMNNPPLDNMKQVFYRNLEGDNRLPTADYAGRTRPIQTPIILTAVNGLVYTVKNMPYVQDLVDNPENWLFWQPSSDWFTSSRMAIKITAVNYIGTVGADTNCCELTLNSTWQVLVYTGGTYVLQDGHTIGGAIMIGSHMAYGTNIRYDVAFRNRQSVRLWDRSLAGVIAVWRHPDGDLRAFVHGDDSTKTGANRFDVHVFKTSGDLMTGDWTDEYGLESNCVIKPYMPSGYLGFHQITNYMQAPNRAGIYMTVVTLYNSSNVIAGLGWLEWNADLTYIKIIPITLTYGGLTIASVPCTSCCFYKGEYLISVQHGTIGTGTGSTFSGKRIILSSKYKESGYDLHSTVFDLSTVNDTQYAGSMMSQYVVNGNLFVYNSELYMINSGAGVAIAEGNGAKHYNHLWKYNDSTGKWNCVVSPLMISWHGYDGVSNYPELPNMQWGRDHISHITPLWIESDRLYFAVMATAGSGTGYHNSFGYIDLSLALS